MSKVLVVRIVATLVATNVSNLAW